MQQRQVKRCSSSIDAASLTAHKFDFSYFILSKIHCPYDTVTNIRNATSVTSSAPPGKFDINVNGKPWGNFFDCLVRLVSILLTVPFSGQV